MTQVTNVKHISHRGQSGRPTRLESVDTTAYQEHVAEETVLQRVDNAAALARPDNIGTTWLEEQYAESEQEQKPLWAAEGLGGARAATVEAAGLGPAADAAVHMVQGHQRVLDAAAERFNDTSEALAPFRRRAPGGKLLHNGAKTALLTGDMVGVTLMGIAIGDYPILAFLMSIAAASAAVIAGLVGAEVRDLRSSQRRRRDRETLTDKQLPFQHLFSGVDEGTKIVKLVCGVSALSALLVAMSIGAGRSMFEGPLLGLIYGGLAFAVAAASFVESYMWSDEIADQIENARSAYERELARHGDLAGIEVLKDRAERAAEAESIEAEHRERGQAGALHVRALRWRILARNPHVVGHGPARSDVQVIGRTNRSAGAK